MNELLLIGSVIIIYGLVLLSYRIFGKTGLYTMMIIVTIVANIEVLMLGVKRQNSLKQHLIIYKRL